MHYNYGLRKKFLDQGWCSKSKIISATMINDLQYPDFEIKVFQFSRSETYISKHSRLEQHFINKTFVKRVSHFLSVLGWRINRLVN